MTSLDSVRGVPTPIAASAFERLVIGLGDTPMSTISLHLLRHRLCRAWIAGSLDAPTVVVIDNLAFDRGEYMAFGRDPVVLWELLRPLTGWWCVNVEPEAADGLAGRIEAETGEAPGRLDDIHHVLTHPKPVAPHPMVRLLDASDVALLADAPPSLAPVGYASMAALLAKGIAAAGVVEGRVVSLVHTSARSPRHANLTAATLPEWRGQGLATAASALVVERIRADDQVPVWSAGATNAASLAVARRLGFVELGRRVYLIRGERPPHRAA